MYTLCITTFLGVKIYTYVFIIKVQWVQFYTCIFYLLMQNAHKHVFVRQRDKKQSLWSSVVDLANLAQWRQKHKEQFNL